MARVYEVMEGKRLDPLITREPLSSAMLSINGTDRHEYTDLVFRTPETLTRFIATLLTMEQEWRRQRSEVAEFHAEPTEVINVASR